MTTRDPDARDLAPQISNSYPCHRLRKALETAASHADAATQTRARERARRWREVLDGMATGRLTVGSRTPVADVPAWVTLKVVKGGFATGELLAEQPVSDEERESYAVAAKAGESLTRGDFNRALLSDTGLERLLAAVESGALRIELPEQGAFAVLAWLLSQDHDAEALELLDALEPWLDRLRFTPELVSESQPEAGIVHLESVAELRQRLRAVTPPARIVEQNEALTVFLPLYDRLVALWLETVEGPAPGLDAEGRVTGGRPGQVRPEGWAERRATFLKDYERACEAAPNATKHRNRKSGFRRLLEPLLLCSEDFSTLDPRSLGRVRVTLAGTLAKHGAPGSEARQALRRAQAEQARAPLHRDFAERLLERLQALPERRGVANVEALLRPVDPPVDSDEAHSEPPVQDPSLAGRPVPASLQRKVERAREAPVDELIGRGVIRSAETLATVAPQITTAIAAGGFRDPALRGLMSRIDAAFRRRRSLLLLDFAHQVRFEELPWVRVLEPLRDRSGGDREAARATLDQLVRLALSAFPATMLPNPMIRECRRLAKAAERPLVLVEEVAADIFMGRFTSKWSSAALEAASTLKGRLYARYYDLPGPEALSKPLRGDARRPLSEDAFAELCRARAREAGTGRGSHVARNGAVIEQSQILTTQNLTALIAALGLEDWLAAEGARLGAGALAAIPRLVVSRGDWRSDLQGVKNAAYALRQALVFLSFATTTEAAEVVEAFAAEVASKPVVAARLAPVVGGLRHVLAGGRFDEDGRCEGGRRLLGWSVGKHWILESKPC